MTHRKIFTWLKNGKVWHGSKLSLRNLLSHLEDCVLVQAYGPTARLVFCFFSGLLAFWSEGISGYLRALHVCLGSQTGGGGCCSWPWFLAQQHPLPLVLGWSFAAKVHIPSLAAVPTDWKRQNEWQLMPRELIYVQVCLLWIGCSLLHHLGYIPPLQNIAIKFHGHSHVLLTCHLHAPHRVVTVLQADTTYLIWKISFSRANLFVLLSIFYFI